MMFLIHSSKTMRTSKDRPELQQKPIFAEQARVINLQLKKLTVPQIARTMRVSMALADKTRTLIAGWTDDVTAQRMAIDSFVGDIYSGLQVPSWSDVDHVYANKHLRVLSGLYGILRPNDGIYPYRCEMGYKVPGLHPDNLYKFWGGTIATKLPNDQSIVNLASKEYGKVVTDYVDPSRIVTPHFLTVHKKMEKPVFVAVHAKIARGAFAFWLVKTRTKNPDDFQNFAELGYRYDSARSTPNEPVFVCDTFSGLGLSIRLLDS